MNDCSGSFWHVGPAIFDRPLVPIFIVSMKTGNINFANRAFGEVNISPLFVSWFWRLCTWIRKNWSETVSAGFWPRNTNWPILRLSTNSSSGMKGFCILRPRQMYDIYLSSVFDSLLFLVWGGKFLRATPRPPRDRRQGAPWRTLVECGGSWFLHLDLSWVGIITVKSACGVVMNIRIVTSIKRSVKMRRMKPAHSKIRDLFPERLAPPAVFKWSHRLTA